MDVNLLVGIVGALVVAFFLRPLLFRGAAAISGAEAKKLVKEGALLVDVRSPAEFAQGNIKGSKNIPLQELPKRLKDFGPANRTIVVCCQSGMRSSMAARALKRAGYARVFNLGGWQNWNR